MLMNTIEWWMLDGAVGLIVLAAVLRGAIKGVGDTIIKMLCIVGGIGLGVYFKDRLKAFLLQTKLERILHSRILNMIKGNESDAYTSSEEVKNAFFGSVKIFVSVCTSCEESSTSTGTRPINSGIRPYLMKS